MDDASTAGEETESAETTGAPEALNQSQVRPPVGSQLEVHLGLAGSPLPVRTLVPRLEFVSGADYGPSLQWAPGRGGRSEDLHDVLWRFVELGDAPDEVIGTFARRYGVLSGRAAPEPDDRLPELLGWELLGGTEPLAAWRGVAGGVAALLDLATDLLLPTNADDDRRVDELRIGRTLAAERALLTVEWLLDPVRDWPLPKPEDAAPSWALRNLQELGPPGDVLGRLGWYVNQLLAETRVRLLAPVLRDDASERYALPALAVDRFEHLPQRPGESDIYYRLPGLLPVLSIALARALEPGKFARCTYCTRLARIQGRRPDPRRAWFGDHEYCRYRSRSEVMREVNQRYRARLAASQEVDERG